MAAILERQTAKNQNGVSCKKHSETDTKLVEFHQDFLIFIFRYFFTEAIWTGLFVLNLNNLIRKSF